MTTPNTDWLDDILAIFDDIAYRPNQYDFEQAKAAILQHEQQAIADYISQLELPENLRTEPRYDKLIKTVIPVFQIYPDKAMDDTYKAGYNSAIGDTTAVLTKAVAELREGTAA